jgi:site-specific recombinase XerD
MSLKLVKRHGSDSWYIRGTVRGVVVDESTKVADKALAESIRAKREWEIVTRQIGGNRAVATFLEAAVLYLENGGEARFVKPLVDYFKTTPLSQIGQAEVETCARRLHPGLAPSTINRKVFTPMSAIMTHAAKRKLCDKPAFERPPQPRGRVRWITLEEADRLISCCAPHLAPLVTFMLFTGCRIGEALALDWRDVDLSRAHASFLDTKNGDRRGTPLHPRAVAALAGLSHRTGIVFRRPDKRPYAPKDDGGGQIKRAFSGACRRAGIADFHPHDCRHTWATWHYAANRDLGALMALGGWRTVTMVMRYAHVNVSNLAPGVMRLGGNPGTLESGEGGSLRKQSDSA